MGKMMQFCRFVFMVNALLFPYAVAVTVDTCRGYPSEDPCLPGGVWDPVLNSCSGYEGRQCYQCYSGEFCSEQSSALQCQLSFTSGDPVYLTEYWIETKIDPCASANAHYRPAYQGSVSEDTNIGYLALLSAIKELHGITKNAETDGYSVISGIGATMVIYTAVESLAQKLLENCSDEDCPDHIDVFAQAPYYMGYLGILKYSKYARWNLSADPNSPWTVEIVTYPNNPNGAKRSPLVADPSRVIMDLVYYWPMYTDINQTMNRPIMIFSGSKHDGLAGTRFGWGLIKDEDLAQRMKSMVYSIMLSQSADIELRILNSLQTIIGMEVGEDGLLPFHKHGRSTIMNRFQQLQDVIDTTPGIHLLNSLSSSGAYVWIHCDGPSTCEEEFNKVNLMGIPGSVFGTSSQEIRFSAMMPSVEFNYLIDKLKMFSYIKRSTKYL